MDLGTIAEVLGIAGLAVGALAGFVRVTVGTEVARLNHQQVGNYRFLAERYNDAIVRVNILTQRAFPDRMAALFLDRRFPMTGCPTVLEINLGIHLN